jgi:hypothetical protein
MRWISIVKRVFLLLNVAYEDSVPVPWCTSRVAGARGIRETEEDEEGRNESS